MIDIRTRKRETQSAPRPDMGSRVLGFIEKGKDKQGSEELAKLVGERRRLWRWERGTKDEVERSRQKERLCRGAPEYLRNLNMEGSQRKKSSEMVGAEAAEGGRGSTRHAKELKLHPLSELQPSGSQSQPHSLSI